MRRSNRIVLIELVFGAQPAQPSHQRSQLNQRVQAVEDLNVCVPNLFDEFKPVFNIKARGEARYWQNGVTK